MIIDLVLETGIAFGVNTGLSLQRRERAVGDRDRAGRTAKQDRLGQGAMDRRFEPGDRIADLAHQTRAPPPNEKNDRKNELAANAIERPSTIWTRRRKPPDVSPKASVRPVTMMM